MRRVVIGVVLALTLLAGAAGPVVACSPLFDPPTIVDLGRDQVVLVGTTGEPAPGGRWFHVERWFNGGGIDPPPAIVIAFKEGPAVGDCSYPMDAGRHLILAPFRNEQGALAADLVTLQADPATPEGKAYINEAVQVFGPGIVPAPADGESAGGFTIDADAAPLLLVGAIAVALGTLAFTGLPRRRPR